MKKLLLSSAVSMLLASSAMADHHGKGENGAQHSDQNMGEQVSETANAVANEAKEAGEAASDTANVAADAVANEAKEAGEAASDTANAAADAVANEAKEAGEAASDTANAAADAVANEAKEAGKAMSETASAAVDATQEAAQSATETVEDMADQADQEASEYSQDAQVTSVKFVTKPDADYLSTDTLIGAQVFSIASVSDADVQNIDQWDEIGNVEDVLLNSDGKMNAVVLSLGGFLGMGQKQIALPTDAFTLVRDPEDPATIYITSDESADVLKNGPEFSYEASAAAEEAPAE